MHSPPEGLSNVDVLAAVRRNWTAEIDRVEHLPVGFGAWHWRADRDGAPFLFVTVDSLGLRHDLVSLDRTYAATAELDAALDSVVASVPTRSGRHAASLGERAISATKWVEGARAGDGAPASREDAVATARILHDLHRCDVPQGIGRWRPLVDVDFAARLEQRLDLSWDRGPHGRVAHDALRDHVGSIHDSTERYHDLAEVARTRDWVATHGEPHSRNQMRTPEGRLLLVDWESLLVAPAERDLHWLVSADHADLVDQDHEMSAMFDLEWRLDEISQYADWFDGPHGDTADDRAALAGLLEAISPG